MQSADLRLKRELLRVFITQPDGVEIPFQPASQASGPSKRRKFVFGDSVSHVEVLTHNASTGRFLAAHAGIYRIRAEYRPLGLNSNELVITARTPEAALVPYSEVFQQLEIAKELQFAEPWTDMPPSFLQPLIDFVGDGPDNIYQHYIAAYLGCLYARRETVEDATVALRYLEPVLQRTDETFPARKELLYFSGSCYAGSGRYEEAIQSVRRLKEEFPDSKLAKKIRDEEMAFLEQRAAEAKQ